MKKIPHTFTIVFALILLAAVCTWIVPSGEFVRQTVSVQNADGSISTREVVQNDSFHYVESQPQTWQVFSSLFNGFVDKADSLFGSVFGMSEETIAFVVIFVPLAISMGYDSIVGVCMCYVAAHVGFAGAMLNPFTIGIAQGIAELPIFSGLEYRFFCWIILTTIGIAFVLWYANRVKRNPERSPMYKLDDYWRQRARVQQENPLEYHSPTAAWVMYGLLSG